MKPRLVVVLLVSAWLFAACSTVPKTGMVPLANPDLSGWHDDGSMESLEQSAKESIRYYQSLPSSRLFIYGKESYTPQEMIQSLTLFLKIIQDSPDWDVFRQMVVRNFDVYESIGETRNLLTGYYFPQVKASLVRTKTMGAPLYGPPDNLLVINLSQFGVSNPARQTLVGRVEGGKVAPYYTRREIQEKSALEGKAEPLAYVNKVDLFFLQTQGSGELLFEDGSKMMVSYAGSNGHKYRSIGNELIRRDVMKKDEVTMQSIRAYLEAHPEKIRPILNSNPSYTFFKASQGGPVGAIGVPLTRERSVAADFRYFPRGGLVFLSTEVPVPGETTDTRPMNRFLLVQDAGGAIRGHGRLDVFWGEGEVAEWVAGHLKHTGRIFHLVAKKKFLEKSLAGN
ncbi:MAG: MltA domain-containing protein, partial [Deltaproteobacteria bacterium]|nr:MltA domain-containing protein [Deltaproteobacteria bacterium]